jgi:hypothetical protein
VEENMRRPRAADARSTSKIDAQSPGKSIYVFRCEETGLYAFAADREGRMLPSQIYPQITWRFEQALTLRLDGNLSRDQILRATLDGVAKRGFHLIHPALYGELVGFTTQDTGTVH